MKYSVFRDPTKFQHLARLLGIDLNSAYGLMARLWYTTSQRARRGDLGRLSNTEISSAVGWNEDPDSLVRALVKARLVDRSPKYRLLVHDWPDHAEEAVKKALARAGETFATDENVETASRQRRDTGRQKATLPETGPVPETVPETGPAVATHRDGVCLDRVVGGPEAIEAVERWAESSRGTRLEPVRNELQRVHDRVGVWGDSPPMVYAGSAASPVMFVPEAVRRIMARKNPPRFKSVAFALGCIDGELAEMRDFGAKSDTAKPAHDYSALAKALEDA